MVDEHLPEVFPLHVEELADAEGPVEGHGDHVVPPDIAAHRLVREAVPGNQNFARLVVVFICFINSSYVLAFYFLFL